VVVDAEDFSGGAADSARVAGQKRPLAFRFEVCVVDGPEGEALARVQAAAIRDVLGWVAENHPAEAQAAEAQEPAGAAPSEPTT
jgi:hypothetical protein